MITNLIHRFFGKPIWVQTLGYIYKGRLNECPEGQFIASYGYNNFARVAKDGRDFDGVTWWPR